MQITLFFVCFSVDERVLFRRALISAFSDGKSFLILQEHGFIFPDLFPT